MTTRFELGAVYATPGFLMLEIDPLPYLLRHAAGDWGDLTPEDRAENEYALQNGYRLLSAYHTPSGVKFWIITEADRSATTILLPEEY